MAAAASSAKPVPVRCVWCCCKVQPRKRCGAESRPPRLRGRRTADKTTKSNNDDNTSAEHSCIQHTPARMRVPTPACAHTCFPVLQTNVVHDPATIHNRAAPTLDQIRNGSQARVRARRVPTLKLSQDSSAQPCILFWKMRSLIRQSLKNASRQHSAKIRPMIAPHPPHPSALAPSDRRCDVTKAVLATDLAAQTQTARVDMARGGRE